MEDQTPFPGGQNPGGMPNDGGTFNPIDDEPKKPSSMVTIATVIIVIAIIIIISNAIRSEEPADDHGDENNDLKVEVVDTTGAGDAYAAGLITGLLTNMPLEKIPYFANAVSALKITKKGAMNIPNRLEVENFMKSFKTLNKN